MWDEIINYYSFKPQKDYFTQIVMGFGLRLHLIFLLDTVLKTQVS